MKNISDVPSRNDENIVGYISFIISNDVFPNRCIRKFIRIEERNEVEKFLKKTGINLKESIFDKFILNLRQKDFKRAILIEKI